MASSVRWSKPVQLVQARFIAVGLERIAPRMVGLNFGIRNGGANHLKNAISRNKGPSLARSTKSRKPGLMTGHVSERIVVNPASFWREPYHPPSLIMPDILLT